MDKKEQLRSFYCGAVLEQDTGVEPAFTAWEAVVLPIYESCNSLDRGYYSRRKGKFQPLFVDEIQKNQRFRAGISWFPLDKFL